MSPEEFLNSLKELQIQGYTVVRANDVGDGYLIFRSQLHQNYISPVSFRFRRLKDDGTVLEHGFNLPFNSWKQILIEGIKDI